MREIQCEVIVRGYTKEGYHLDLIVADEIQTRSTVTGVKEVAFGHRIVPSEFPEMAYFEVIIHRR
jgi:hypothetical protein